MPFLKGYLHCLSLVLDHLLQILGFLLLVHNDHNLVCRQMNLNFSGQKIKECLANLV